MKNNESTSVPKSWEIVIVTAVLLLHFSLGFTSLIQKSLTFDEPAHIAGGLDCWINGNFGMTPDNGVLPQKIETLPLLFMEDCIQANSPAWDEKTTDDVQKKILFNDFSRTDIIVESARIPVLAVSVLTGLFLFFVSRCIFGSLGALITLFLYCLSPTILAHSCLATSDLIASSAFIISIWAVWKTLHKINATNILLSSISISMLCLSKMSFFIIIPIYLVLIFFRICSGTPLPVAFKSRVCEFKSQKSQFMVFLCLALLNAVFVILMVWSFYGLRFEMGKDYDPQAQEQRWQTMLDKTGRIGKIANFARKSKIMPEAFTYGFLSVYHYSRQRYAFMDGELSNNGWWIFFPYSFLIKTPIPLFCLMLIAIFAVFQIRRQALEDKKTDESLPTNKNVLYELLPYIVFIGIYVTFAIASRINIGHRHLLPIYPALFLLAGSVSYFFKTTMQSHRVIRLAVILSCVWFFTESLMIWPDYLAYFNQFSGGPKNGYKHLVDSSLDWGQDLKKLKLWTGKNRGSEKNPLYLSYFGTDIPERFALDAKILPGFHPFDRKTEFFLEKGTYVISATMLQFVYFPELYKNETGLDPTKINDELYQKVKGPAEKEILEYMKNPISGQSQDYKLYNMLRFAKLCLYLRDRQPDDFIGYSLLVHKLSDDEIRKALE